MASSDLRNHLHELLDPLSENQIPQAAQALESIHHSKSAALLRDIPGLEMPDHWPPQYRDVEPLTLPGEPGSEKLVRERR